VPELIAHLLGDYVLQSDWMAQEKTKRWGVAVVHAIVYSLPFLLLCSPSPAALAVMVLTHAIIDRLRLAKYVGYAKNFLSPRSFWYAWADCEATGYHKDRPAWLAVWLLIITDNAMHLLINHLALRYL
jgi:hypothetical protein